MAVLEPSPNELLRLRKSGVSLDSAWREYADPFVLTVLQADPEKDPLLFGLHNRRYKELVRRGLPETKEGRTKELESVIQEARSHLLREIYSGHLWAIGFRTLPSGTSELVLVPRRLFLFDEAGEHKRPDIHWRKSELTVGTGSFLDIRIIRPPPGVEESSATATAATAIPNDAARLAATHIASSPEGQARTTDERSTERNSPGRPSHANVIRAAIAEQARTDPRLERPRRERYENYRAYAKSQGYDPRRDDGFSEKTFEKYERQFRNKHKKGL